MSRDRTTAQRAITAAKRVQAPPTAEFRRATVIQGGAAPTVLIDGASSPVPATPSADIPSAGQRVLVTYTLGGAVLVTDILGGQWRNLGSTHVTAAQTGITAEVALTDLAVDITIPYPGRLVTIYCKVFCEAAAGAPFSPVLRVREDDVSGALIGIVDELTMTADGDNACLQGQVLWETPDDDEVVVAATLSGGAGTIDTLSSSTRVATLNVSDAGYFLPDVGP